MEPASTDDRFTVAAVPMPLRWLDVGSWPSFSETCEPDERRNVSSGCKSATLDSSGCIMVSNDPEHLIASIGIHDMIVIHTGNATLICPKAEAEKIKALHQHIDQTFGSDYL